ncbi:MAG: plasmid mobilization relaxosome protein MobC [Alphaproteobacteria bacterium]|nr:plasmid mobilization relaxosome protein MobC [Alphaproteobacteria bacterium]
MIEASLIGSISIASHSSIKAQFRVARGLTGQTTIALVTPSSVTDEPYFAKSYAQVATSVRPQVVRPKSGELKLGRHRPHRLMGRFSDDEKETVEAKAKAANLSLNEYIRAVSLGGDYKAPHDPEWTKALLAANRELTRQGTNLNQIAHKRNSNLIDEAQTDSLIGILTRSLLQAHRAVRAALTYGRRPEP